MSGFEFDPSSSATDMAASQDDIDALGEAAQVVARHQQFEAHQMSMSTVAFFATYPHAGSHIAISLIPGYNRSAYDVRLDTIQPLRERRSGQQIVTSETVYFFEASSREMTFRLDNVYQSYCVRNAGLNHPRILERPKHHDTRDMPWLRRGERRREISHLENILRLQAFTMQECVELVAAVKAFSPQSAKAMKQKG